MESNEEGASNEIDISGDQRQIDDGKTKTTPLIQKDENATEMLSPGASTKTPKQDNISTQTTMAEALVSNFSSVNMEESDIDVESLQQAVEQSQSNKAAKRAKKNRIEALLCRKRILTAEEECKFQELSLIRRKKDYINDQLIKVLMHSD